MTSTPNHTRHRLPSSPFTKSRDAEAALYIDVAVGDRVSHDRYGLGRAVRLDGPRAVIIDFGGELRRVATNSPRLELL